MVCTRRIGLVQPRGSIKVKSHDKSRDTKRSATVTLCVPLTKKKRHLFQKQFEKHFLEWNAEVLTRRGNRYHFSRLPYHSKVRMPCLSKDHKQGKKRGGYCSTPAPNTHWVLLWDYSFHEESPSAGWCWKHQACYPRCNTLLWQACLGSQKRGWWHLNTKSVFTNGLQQLHQKAQHSVAISGLQQSPSQPACWHWFGKVIATSHTRSAQDEGGLTPAALSQECCTRFMVCNSFKEIRTVPEWKTQVGDYCEGTTWNFGN